MFLPFSVEIEESVIRRRRVLIVLPSIIVLCAIVHVWLSSYVSQEGRLDALYQWGTMSFRFRWWTPVTCTFLHGGWGHLFGNMYFLWIYGRELERRLGYARFAALYFLGALMSVLVHLVTLSCFSTDVPTIGASGAVSAILGAFLVFWPTAKLRCAFFSIISFRPIIIVLPAWVVLGLWFAGQLLYTLELAGHHDGIAFWAHVAGFAGGAAIATWFGRMQQKEEERVQAALRAPMVEAWQNLLGGRLPDAEASLPAIDDVAIGDMRGSCQFVRGLVAMRRGYHEDGAGRFLRAFSQARDYRNDDAVLTIYLQMLRYMEADEIPPAMHKDAGLAARAMGCHSVMLGAFGRAVRGGCQEGVDTMCRAVRAELNRRKAVS